MAITTAPKGTAGDKTATSTSLQMTPTTTINVGDLLFVAVFADNAGTAGVSSITTPTDTVGGNTYTLVKAQNRTAASAANDGCTVALYKCVVATQIPSGGGAQIQANFSPATLARTMCAFVAQGANTTEYSTNSTSGTGATYTDLTSASMANGDLIVSAVANESALPPVADTDTTNGAWDSSSLTATSGGSGGDATKISGRVQWKMVTGAGTQQANAATGANTDWATVHALFTAAAAPAFVPGIARARSTSNQLQTSARRRDLRRRISARTLFNITALPSSVEVHVTTARVAMATEGRAGTAVTARAPTARAVLATEGRAPARKTAVSTARSFLTLVGYGMPTHVVAISTSGLSLSTVVGYAPTRKAVTRVAHNPIAVPGFASPYKKNSKPVTRGDAGAFPRATPTKGARPVAYSPTAVPAYAAVKSGRLVLAELDAPGSGLALARKAVTRLARAEAVAAPYSVAQKAVNRTARVDATLLAWPMASRVATIFEIGHLAATAFGYTPVKPGKATTTRGDIAVLPYTPAKKTIAPIARSEVAALPFSVSRKNSPQSARLHATAVDEALVKTNRAEFGRMFPVAPGYAVPRKAVTRTAFTPIGVWNPAVLSPNKVAFASLGLVGYAPLVTGAHRPSGRSDLGVWGRALVAPGKRPTALGELGLYGPAITRHGFVVFGSAPLSGNGRATLQAAHKPVAYIPAAPFGTGVPRKAVTRTARGDIALGPYAMLKTMRTGFGTVGAVGFAVPQGAHRATGLTELGVVGYAISVKGALRVANLDVRTVGRASVSTARNELALLPATVLPRTVLNTRRNTVARQYVAPAFYVILAHHTATGGPLYLAVTGWVYPVGPPPISTPLYIRVALVPPVEVGLVPPDVTITLE